MQRKVTIKKKSAAKKTNSKKNSPNKAKRTPKKEVATKTNDVDSDSGEDKFRWREKREGEKGTGYFSVVESSVRMLEALRAENS